MITQSLIAKMMPKCANPSNWATLLDEELKKYDIVSNEQIARFVAQCGHESNNFNTLEENLNYSADRLMEVFPKYFKDKDVHEYHKNSEKIANVVYANRLGNGDTESGDGFKYRGRGLIQVTGKTNYKECSKFIFDNENLITDPGLLLIPEYALKSAIWYWDKNKLNDVTDMKVLTKKINGGTHGLEDRIQRYETALAAFGN